MGANDPIPGFPTSPGNPRDPGRDSEQAIFDTVVGPNLRLKDNLFQAVAIVVFLAVGIPIGYFAFPEPDRSLGAAVGGVGGLLLGLFGSGFALMIYRGFIRPAGKGERDGKR